MQKPAPIPHIVILGGGSAGWIAASLINQRWGAGGKSGRGAKVTLVESPEIGIIGVGEGSTPQLKAFFDEMGIAEADWMPACDATYKLGIRFDGWSRRPGFESYFHPFASPVDLHTEPAFVKNCALMRRGYQAQVNPDGYFLASRLAEARLGPQPAASFPFEPFYGYHFDAYKLGAFLRDHAVARGVEHVSARVLSVAQDANGAISALHCDDDRVIAGDFFVDCSGFAAVLAEKTLGARHISFAENLFSDRAVVMPTDRIPAYLPQTGAIAMDAGWRWHIPLTARTGNGYVYSSGAISDDAAETELRTSLGMLDSPVEARFLKMRVGRLENSWTSNCLAVGLAQGFIEPLEATALHIVISTVADFLTAFDQAGETAQNQFNAHVAARYEAIRDYIVAHYRMNQRDGDYWAQNAGNQALSDRLKAMMTAWFTQADMASALTETYQDPAYANLSWHCLFAGYGTFPPAEKLKSIPAGFAAADKAETARLLDRCAMNFVPLPVL